VNKNYLSALHIDKNNLGPSYIIGVGEYEDGELWVQDLGKVDCKHSWELFDGNIPHCTMPYKGTRYTLIYFTQQSYEHLGKHKAKTEAGPNTWKAMKECGFTRPPPGLEKKQYVSDRMRLMQGEEAFKWWQDLSSQGKNYNYNKLKSKHTITEADVLERYGSRDVGLGLEDAFYVVQEREELKKKEGLSSSLSMWLYATPRGALLNLRLNHAAWKVVCADEKLALRLRKKAAVSYTDALPGYDGYRFKEKDFDMENTLDMEVEEEDGTWRRATFYRRKNSEDVVMWFGDTDEYEGMAGGYRLTEGVLQDADGDTIIYRAAPVETRASNATFKQEKSHEEEKLKAKRVKKEVIKKEGNEEVKVEISISEAEIQNLSYGQLQARSGMKQKCSKAVMIKAIIEKEGLNAAIKVIKKEEVAQKEEKKEGKALKKATNATKKATEKTTKKQQAATIKSSKDDKKLQTPQSRTLESKVKREREDVCETLPNKKSRHTEKTPPGALPLLHLKTSRSLKQVSVFVAYGFGEEKKWFEAIVRSETPSGELNVVYVEDGSKESFVPRERVMLPIATRQILEAGK